MFQTQLDSLLRELDAVAAGLWRAEPAQLVLLGFRHTQAVTPEVAAAFQNAVNQVPLNRDDLSIVRAATRGGLVLSRVEELPEDVGSGYWLRAFNARLSIASVMANANGDARAVVSVAMNRQVVDLDQVRASYQRLATLVMPRL